MIFGEILELELFSLKQESFYLILYFLFYKYLHPKLKILVVDETLFVFVVLLVQ